MAKECKYAVLICSRSFSQPCPFQEETIANLLSTLDRLNSAKQDNAFPVLKVGDSVERGPDWKWDTQDELNGARRCTAAPALALFLGN